MRWAEAGSLPCGKLWIRALMSLGWEFSVQVSAALAFHRGDVQLGSSLELLLFLPTSSPLPGE